jgi:hypothetical protein
MRRGWVLGLALAACGGGQKTGGATQNIAGSDAAGSTDLQIPKVDEALCDAKGKDVQQFDLNRDNKPDIWKLYKSQNEKGTTVSIMTCEQVDLDHDGKKDYVVRYDDTGAILSEEYDFDFDAKFDARFHYDKKTGNKYLVERTSGFSGKPDSWEKYTAAGKLDSIRRDRNADGKPDLWEQYREGILEKILYDDDYDGKVERQEEAKRAEAPAPTAPTTAPAAGEPAAEGAAPAPGSPASPEPATPPAKPAPKKKK